MSFLLNFILAKATGECGVVQNETMVQGNVYFNEMLKIYNWLLRRVLQNFANWNDNSNRRSVIWVRGYKIKSNFDM
jgi:hypothetical protein